MGVAHSGVSEQDSRPALNFHPPGKSGWTEAIENGFSAPSAEDFLVR